MYILRRGKFVGHLLVFGVIMRKTSGLSYLRKSISPVITFYDNFRISQRCRLSRPKVSPLLVFYWVFVFETKRKKKENRYSIKTKELKREREREKKTLKCKTLFKSCIKRKKKNTTIVTFKRNVEF